MDEHKVTNNCPGYETGVCADPKGEHKTGPPNIVIIPEKTTAWSEAELTGGREATDYVPAPALPPQWLLDFPPGTTFNVNGWECAVRHVGQEEGHWLMLVEPVRCTRPVMSRSEYRRLKAQLGKKEANRRYDQAWLAKHHLDPDGRQRVTQEEYDE